LEFEVKLFWDVQEGGSALFNQDISYHFDLPKEFGGKAIYSSPEEFFFFSVASCLITSFVYFQRKLGFAMQNFQAAARGRLDSVGPQGHRVTGVVVLLKVEINRKDDEKVRRCFQLTREFCPITRTLEKCILIDVSLEIAYNG
jgi:uncharacterized OsmC-like protein